MVENNYKLGEFLKEQRRNKGLSLKEVEEEIEISASYLNRLEKGNRQNPSIFVLERLSKFYGLEPKLIMSLAGFECEQEGSNNIIEIMTSNQVITVNGIEVPGEEFREVVKLLFSVNTSDFLSLAELANKIKCLQNSLPTSQILGA